MGNNKKTSKKKFLILLTIVTSLLFIFPNDYKHFIPNGDLVMALLAGLPLGLVYVKYFPRIVNFMRKYLLFSIPFLIMIVWSCVNGDDVKVSLSKILYLLIFYFVGAFLKDYKKEILRIAEIISFCILLINGLVTIFHIQPLLYTATAGRIFFIFEGDVGKLLAANILLYFLNVELDQSRYKWLHYIVYGFSLYCISFSATYFFCDTLLLLYMLFVKNKKIKAHLPKFTILYAILLLLVNILVISGSLSVILSDVFDKTTTLSGRTIIWGSAIEIIRGNWLLGIGDFAPGFFIDLTGVGGATHAHNQLLQILLNSGIVGLFVYIYYIYRAIRPGKELKDDDVIITYRGYLFVILIMSLTTVSFDAFFNLSLLAIVYYIDTKKSFGKEVIVERNVR